MNCSLKILYIVPRNSVSVNTLGVLFSHLRIYVFSVKHHSTPPSLCFYWASKQITFLLYVTVTLQVSSVCPRFLSVFLQRQRVIVVISLFVLKRVRRAAADCVEPLSLMLRVTGRELLQG